MTGNKNSDEGNLLTSLTTRGLPTAHSVSTPCVNGSEISIQDMFLRLFAIACKGQQPLVIIFFIFNFTIFFHLFMNFIKNYELT